MMIKQKSSNVGKGFIVIFVYIFEYLVLKRTSLLKIIRCGILRKVLHKNSKSYSD